MAKIPLGNFGNAIPQSPGRTQIPAEAFDSGGRALQQLGNVGMKLAADQMDHQRRLDEKVQLLTAHAGIQNSLADLHDQTVRGIEDGSIPKDKAESAFTGSASSQVNEKLQGLPPDLQKIMQAESLGITGRYTNMIRDAVVKRGQQEARVTLNDYLEQTQREALMDREKATERAMAAIDGIGPGAGMSPVAIQQAKQSAREGIAYTLAKRMVSGATHSIEAVDNALKTLDSQEYADLEPKRREVLHSSLMASRLRLESKFQTEVNRLEAKAERTIARIDQQIASGVPATPDMWIQWEQETRGTSQAEAFKDRLKSEEEVQRLLREPPEKQAAFIQEKEAALLQNGGNIRDKANLDRLKRVLDASQKQLEEAPLLFAQNRTGEPVKPLDLAMLLDPSKGTEMADLIANRVATVTALRNQYGGDKVKARVLLPNEAEALTKGLNQMAPDQQVEVFRAVRQAIGDDVAYQGTLAQIAQDSPVKALAGTLAARGADYVQTHLFSPDETISARQTAQLALLGESLLNPTSARKAQDGKTNTWIMPKKADMLRRFNDKVGDTFAGTPQAMDAQFELVQATYAGLMATRGANKNPEIIDSALFDQAVERTTPVMKQGGASFLKPVAGMSDDQFREKLRTALPDDLKPQYDRLPLRNYRSNQYIILNGARPLADKDGNPIIVTVKP